MRVCAWHIGGVGGARAALSWLQWRWLRRRSHTSNCSGRRRKCIHTTSSCRAICVPGCGRSRRTCVGADVALVRAPVVNAAVVACVSVVVASARAPVIIVAVVVTGLAVAVVASVAAAHAVATINRGIGCSAADRSIRTRRRPAATRTIATATSVHSAAAPSSLMHRREAAAHWRGPCQPCRTRVCGG